MGLRVLGLWGFEGLGFRVFGASFRSKGSRGVFRSNGSRGVLGSLLECGDSGARVQVKFGVGFRFSGSRGPKKHANIRIPNIMVFQNPLSRGPYPPIVGSLCSCVVFGTPKVRVRALQASGSSRVSGLSVCRA